MARRQITTTVGEHTYTITLLDARTALRVGHKLLASAGSLLSLDSVEKMTGAAFASLSTDDLEWIAGEFAKTTLVQIGDRTPSLSNGPEHWPEHFSGRFGELLEWLVECTIANFTGLGVSMGRLGNKYGHLIESQTTDKQ